MVAKLTPKWKRITDRLSVWTLPGGAQWILGAVDESEDGGKVFKKRPPTTGYELFLGIPNLDIGHIGFPIGKYHGTESRQRAETVAVRMTRRMQVTDIDASRAAGKA